MENSGTIDCQAVACATVFSHIDWHDELDSTNTFAAAVQATAEELPWVIGATRQSQGRGRGSHAWWSKSGSLTFSLLAEPEAWNIPPARWPLLSLVVGLSVCEALESFAPSAELSVKWPNDVYADGRKIAGILIESNSHRPEQLVIGIGVNVNNSLSQAPAPLNTSATALCDLQGTMFSLTEVLTGLLHQLNQNLNELGHATAELARRYRGRCFLTGKMITLRHLEQEVTGMCQGIDDDGALRLLTWSGPQPFYAGTVVSIGS
jgi:BirA family biotin operon repressor/biotin-[acetyl-CoA-carboxylase] ligase